MASKKTSSRKNVSSGSKKQSQHRSKKTQKVTSRSKQQKNTNTSNKYKPTGFQSTGRVKSSKKKSSVHEKDPYSHLEQNETEPPLMTIGDHLEELRKRLIYILIIVTTFSIAVGIFSPLFHTILLDPFYQLTGENLIMGKAYGGLLVLMKLSVLTGSLIAMPFLFYIAWGFITPAVTTKTRIIGNLIVAVSSLLFWSGVAVCWIYIFPLSLKFLFMDTRLWGVDAIHPVEEYYSFLFTLHLGSGITFQLPLVIVVLGAARILTMDWHTRFWKYILVFIFILAALLTPPDPISQLFLGSLLSIMYGVSVLIVFLIEKTRNHKLRKT